MRVDSARRKTTTAGLTDFSISNRVLFADRLLCYLLIVCLLFAVVSPLYADEAGNHYDRVHLSASATSRIENDTMVATLYAEAEGSQAAALASKVNQSIQWALRQLSGYDSIHVQTNAYSSQPVYQNKKIKGWRIRQSIRLESRNMTLMSDVLGKLQQKLALQSMQFSVSPQSKNQQDEKLIAQALQAFEQRARAVTEKLKRQNYKLVDLRINTSASGGPRPVYAMRAMAMDDTLAAPAVSAGEQSLTVTINGEIELE